MREDLQQFENRSDDWLAKQRKYEENVSAWDLDEGRKIKEEHAIRHAAYNNKEKYFKEYQQREKVNNQEIDTKGFINTMEIIITIAIIVMIILSNL